jgi:hypothetical protein
LQEDQVSLLAVTTKFIERLKNLHGPVEKKFMAVVYFDEAHTLHTDQSCTSLRPHTRNPYFALMHAMSNIAHKPIFFVFLSTNTSLHSFAPTNAMFPSARVRANQQLIPPYFELPMDIFCEGFTQKLKDAGELTLSGVCQLKHMTKFGRAL